MNRYKRHCLVLQDSCQNTVPSPKRIVLNAFHSIFSFAKEKEIPWIERMKFKFKQTVITFILEKKNYLPRGKLTLSVKILQTLFSIFGFGIHCYCYILLQILVSPFGNNVILCAINSHETFQYTQLCIILIFYII